MNAQEWQVPQHPPYAEECIGDVERRVLVDGSLAGSRVPDLSARVGAMIATPIRTRSQTTAPSGGSCKRIQPAVQCSVSCLGSGEPPTT
jgi:hypothetical protein